MPIKDIELLNNIYKPLCEKSSYIEASLKANGYKIKKGFFNNHSIRDKTDNWITEYFPIPVLTVDQLCDICIDITSICIEAKLKREVALEFDFNEFLEFKFEVYGVLCYLTDFYNDTLPINTIHKSIEISDEKEIGLEFKINKNCTADILKIINILKKLHAYIN